MGGEFAAASDQPGGGEVIEHQRVAGQMLPGEPLLDAFLGIVEPVERGIDLLELRSTSPLSLTVAGGRPGRGSTAPRDALRSRFELEKTFPNPVA